MRDAANIASASAKRSSAVANLTKGNSNMIEKVDASACRWRGLYMQDVERIVKGKKPMFTREGKFCQSNYHPQHVCPMCGRGFRGPKKQVCCSCKCATARRKAADAANDEKGKE